MDQHLNEDISKWWQYVEFTNSHLDPEVKYQRDKDAAWIGVHMKSICCILGSVYRSSLEESGKSQICPYVVTVIVHSITGAVFPRGPTNSV